MTIANNFIFFFLRKLLHVQVSIRPNTIKYLYSMSSPLKIHPVSHSSTDDQDQKKGGGGSGIGGLKFPYAVFLENEKEKFCEERQSLKPTHNDVSVW